jgi:hypothetical protein
MAGNSNIGSKASCERTQSSFPSHASSTSTVADDRKSDGLAYRDRALPSTPDSRVGPIAEPDDVDKMLGPNPAACDTSLPTITPHAGRPTTHAQLLSQHPIYRENPFSGAQVRPDPTGAKQLLQDYLSVQVRSDDLTQAMSSVVTCSDSFDVYPTQFDLVPTTATTMLINMKMELNELEQICLHVANDSLRSSVATKVTEIRKLITRTETVITHGLVGNMQKALHDRDQVFELTGLMADRIQVLEGGIRESEGLLQESEGRRQETEDRMQRLKAAFSD